LARAHRWQGMLEGGEYGSIEELARAEKINPSYLARVLRLTLLAPEIPCSRPRSWRASSTGGTTPNGSPWSG
jgi:hypothetical protein